MYTYENYADNRKEPFKIMKMKKFTILGKAKPNTDNTRDFNLMGTFDRLFV
jgi:hypothetical protein